MPAFDAAAITLLDDEQVIVPVFYAWLDILGDPIRACTAGMNIAIEESGDAELDGDYIAVDPQAVSVSEVSHREGGSDTVTVALSGLLLPDAELLATIADRANWQGRTCRLWVQVRDETGTAAGAIAPYYTGYMAALDIVPAPELQVIQITIENYLAALGEPTNRTYLSQTLFDPADTSAAATLAAANNARSGQGGGAGYAATSTQYARRLTEDFVL
ncbi:hypothetical protein [Tsuneonella sp. HG222]